MKSEIVKTKQLIKDIDEVLHKVKEISYARETSLAVTKLQEGIMWLDMYLKTLNGPNHYSESKDESGNYAAPTADELKL